MRSPSPAYLGQLTEIRDSQADVAHILSSPDPEPSGVQVEEHIRSALPRPVEGLQQEGDLIIQSFAAVCGPLCTE
jgi:hypothetical protein